MVPTVGTFVGRTLGTNSYGSIIDGDYGATEAVVELSFDIFEGEVFGLLGPNGAGKTTTISMLASAHRPSAGDATLFGHSIRNLQPSGR